MKTEFYWLSSKAMTVGVRLEDGRIAAANPPIVRRFIGQPFANLVRWMRGQGGFRMERL